ncbi:MAG TPA: hypothetical protein VKE27_04680, partial [Candidatus Dormibacteraeota bacterium]|nr:hypothetical protein [Candidatus Dormibacteraeota bacterium]
MSDTQSAFPPPPAGGIPSPLPNYQPPAVSEPPVGYPPSWQQQPWQQQQPNASVGAGWGTVGILSQFGGS